MVFLKYVAIFAAGYAIGVSPYRDSAIVTFLMAITGGE